MALRRMFLRRFRLENHGLWSPKIRRYRNSPSYARWLCLYRYCLRRRIACSDFNPQITRIPGSYHPIHLRAHKLLRHPWRFSSKHRVRHPRQVHRSPSAVVKSSNFVLYIILARKNRKNFVFSCKFQILSLSLSPIQFARMGNGVKTSMEQGPRKPFVRPVSKRRLRTLSFCDL